MTGSFESAFRFIHLQVDLSEGTMFVKCQTSSEENRQTVQPVYFHFATKEFRLDLGFIRN